MCVTSLLCGPRADLWPFYGFLCKRFSLYIKVYQVERKPFKLSPEEQERRTLLLKEWSRYKMKQHKEELQRVQELERYGEEALKELKKSSLYLCHEAIKQGSK